LGKTFGGSIFLPLKECLLSIQIREIVLLLKIVLNIN
jgi:hypothetical protein